MAPNSTVASPNSTPATAKLEVVPPEERFWKRYSGHFEFPLSGFTSLALHGLVVAVVVYGIIIANKLHLGEDTKPLPLDAIVIAGGGGDPNGAEGAPGGEAPPPPSQELAVTPPKETTSQQNPVPDDKDLPKVPDAIDPLTLPDASESERSVSEEASPLEALKSLSKEARSKLFNNLPVASKGEGGTGRDGGKGKGRDKGEGDLTGAGKATINQRQKRVLRWSMIFNTQNGEDYRRQLAGLGAYLAVPIPEGGYKVYENLGHAPFQGSVVDLATIKRIFWVDDKAESIASLFMAMGIPPPYPPHIVAFFPESLEKELLIKEKAYRGLPEDRIRRTVFTIEFRGGKYQPIVRSQE